MTGRLGPRRPVYRPPVRRGRTIRRASAGLLPGPGRGGPGRPGRGRGDLWRRELVGVPVHAAAGRSRPASTPIRPRWNRRSRRRPRREPVPHRHRPAGGDPRVAANGRLGAGQRAAPGHAGRHLARTRSPSSCGRWGTAGSSSMPTGRCSPRRGDGSSGDAADLPVVDDRRAASAGLVVGTTLAEVDLDAATRLASLVPDRHRQRRGRSDRQPHRRERVRAADDAGELERHLRVLHRQPADAGADPRARSACCVAC